LYYETGNDFLSSSDSDAQSFNVSIWFSSRICKVFSIYFPFHYLFYSSVTTSLTREFRVHCFFCSSLQRCCCMYLFIFWIVVKNFSCFCLLFCRLSLLVDDGGDGDDGTDFLFRLEVLCFALFCEITLAPL
jgi:hypothetical protein